MIEKRLKNNLLQFMPALLGNSISEVFHEKQFSA